MLRKFIPLVFLFSVSLSVNLIAQSSTSVFDANYFDKDNSAPPLKIGRGFHINDVYRQTKGCFTPESSKPSNLTPQQTAKKTTIKIYYTKTNEEYNAFRKRGASGKISFLNLFSAGGKKIEEYANKDITDEERIIFFANVDFGMYSYDIEPKLTDEAQSLIDQKKWGDFVGLYGSHYISGVKRENNVTVVLTKVKTENDNSSSESNEIDLSGKNPIGWKGSLQAESTDKMNSILMTDKFTAEIEIHGPDVELTNEKEEINNILNGNSDKKADAISSIIAKSLKNMSDPNQSLITQFYYSPFELYQLKGVFWDEKKQTELIKLNEAIVTVYSAKTLLNEMLSESGKKQFLDAIGADSGDQENNQKFLAAYNKSVPLLTNLKTKADGYFKNLELRYVKCADIYCPNTVSCCTNEAYIQEIENFNFSSKIDKEQNKIFDAMMKVAAEVYAPECQKKKMGIVNIENLSVNPYSLYQGDEFIGTIKGKETLAFTLPLGDYYFKAVQDSGFLMYATTNQRRASLKEVCQEVNLRVGFED